LTPVAVAARAHVATPEELRSRIEAERRGSPFLLYRDGAGEQAILTLEELDPTDDRPPARQRDRAGVDSEVSRVHAALQRVGEDWGRRRRPVAQRHVGQRRARHRPPAAA
jgi:hypothetical protein